MEKMTLDAFQEPQTLNPWMYDSFQETDEGFLKGRAVVTNIGIFPYYVDGKIVNKLRLPEEVMSAESLETLRGKPLTNDHPSVPVDSDNIETYQVGNIGSDIRVDGYSVSADILITHADTIDLVKQGKVALSCGYFSKTEVDSGTKWGQPYDARQTDIRYNHVAIVDAGRAGEDAQMYLDSKENFICGLVSENQIDKPQEQIVDTKDVDTKEKTMEYRKIMLDNKEVEVQVDAADEVLTLQKDRDAFSAKAEELEGKVTAFEAQVDGLEAELATAKSEKEVALDSVDGLVASGIESRIAVIGVAKELEVEFDSADTNIVIKKKVVLAQYDNSETISAKMDEKGEAYVDGLFDRISETCEDAKEVEAEVGKEVLDKDGKEKKEGTKSLSMDEARQKYLDSFKKEGK